MFPASKTVKGLLGYTGVSGPSLPGAPSRPSRPGSPGTAGQFPSDRAVVAVSTRLRRKRSRIKDMTCFIVVFSS